MGKWTCKCGNPMNDHNAPNENGCVVYSEYDRGAIESSADDDGSISLFDIPDQKYDVYRCPRCGRLMVFGESNRCLSYKPEFDLSEANEILSKSVEIGFK